MSFKASAPGSLMLLGEYAVLQGKHALVCAVDKRMTVTIEPRNDTKIFITSSLGQHTTKISTLKVESPFQFVLATLKKFKKMLTTGCDINITAEFSHQVGFASSAAVTVATLTALSNWLNLSFSKLALVEHARAIVRSVQGLGSGADVAACVFGGIVVYRMRPLLVDKLPFSSPITVVYSGHKTPTVEAVKRVQDFFATQPKLFRHICQVIDNCVLQGVSAIREQQWAELGKVMNIQQGLMDALGVNTPVLNGLISDLRQYPTILGAKISGSGLGDCVIGLGQHHSSLLPGEILVNISEQGVFCEKK